MRINLSINSLNIKLVLASTLFFIINFNAISQIGIGTSTPNESSALDIKSNTSGILIPRISLTSTTDTNTIDGLEEVSLLLYNTATINDVTPGFYYWVGSKWLKISNIDTGDWSLTGNSNISQNTIFLGTLLPNQDIIFKTNNVNRMVLNSRQGQLIVGENIIGSSDNALLKISSDVEVGGGSVHFDGGIENIELRSQSQDWVLASFNKVQTSDSYFMFSRSDNTFEDPPFLISEDNFIAIGGGDTNPKDILHVVKDKNLTTTIRIDNDESRSSITPHTSLRLYDGDQLKGSFQHNNSTNILEIGHPETTGIVELISNSIKTMTLEKNSSVTIQSLMNIKPGPIPLNPIEGDVYYDITDQKLRVYNGSIWNDLN